jgi:polysaccharide pyruvyl transferase WcaK-like protein
MNKSNQPEVPSSAPPTRALRRRRRVVLVGDVGVEDGRYHLGDEAMLGAAIQQLRARGDVEITVLSKNPRDTAIRYGVVSVPGFGRVFPATSGDDAHWLELEHLLAIAKEPGEMSGLASSARASVETMAGPGLDAIRSADSIIITGGGNLNSEWPSLLFERLAVAELASLFGIDLVLSSQSIGPRVDHPHQGPLARIIQVARVVGLRESGSVATLERLRLISEKIVHTPDDAFALTPGSESSDGWTPRVDRYVAATFARHPGIVTPETHLADARAAVQSLARVTQLPVLLIGHEGILGSMPASGDTLFHEEIASGLVGLDVTVMPQSDAEATMRVTGRAEFVVSTRYHQIIDAIGQAVPAIGISIDGYCENKLGGALRDAGLGSLSLTMNTVSSGSFDAVLSDTWLNRTGIAQHLAGLVDARQQRLSRWWDLLCDGSGVGDAPMTADWEAAEFSGENGFAGTSAVMQERTWFLAASDQFDRLRTDIDAGQRALRYGEREAVFDYRLAEVHAENELLQERNENLEAALAASSGLLTRLGDPLFAPALARRKPTRSTRTDESQLDALLRTRTLRWTRGPRRLYRGIRTGFTDWDVLG